MFSPSDLALQGQCAGPQNVRDSLVGLSNRCFYLLQFISLSLFLDNYIISEQTRNQMCIQNSIC